MPRVADGVHARRNRDRPGDRDEEPAQPVRRELQPRQRQQARQDEGKRPAGQRGDPGDEPRGARQRGPGSGGGRAQPPGQRQHRQRGQQRDGRGETEPGSHRVHRPVSSRSAATIASGRGGHPGTSASTGSMSRTAPVTPYAFAKTPQSRAQSPTATTSFGAGTAS